MLFLGVDGGGTKTGFTLIDGSGRIVARAVLGSSYYLQIQFAGFRNIISEGITAVCRQAGIAGSEIAYSFLGLSAFGEIEADTERLEAIVGEILGNLNFRCGNDVEAGWAGSLACQPGINIVAGTGAIGFGRDDAGNAARVSGWGEFCGDEGSAYWLGKQLISAFSKQADGREPKTPLYEIVRREFRLHNDFDLIAIVYEQLMPKREEIAKLALLAHEAAQRGDTRALSLYDQAAYEQSLMVKALLNQLGFAPGKDVPVSYSGGVFRAGDVILKPLRQHLAGERVRLTQPLLSPATGAALYAMKLSGRSISPAMVAELKKQEAAGNPS